MQMRKGLARSASQKSRDETRLAKQHLLKEFTHFQPEQAEDSRFLVAGLHALSAALTVTALFASGRQSIHLAEIDGVYVGAIWSHGCSRQKEDCFPSDQANRIFLIGAHAVGKQAVATSAFSSLTYVQWRRFTGISRFLWYGCRH